MNCRKSRPLALAFALAASALLPSGASAQSVYSADRIIQSAHLDDLEAVVASLGHEVVKAADNGSVSMLAKADNDVVYILDGTACDANGVPGCQGVLLQVRYDLPDSVSYESVSKANLTQAAIKTWIDIPDKTLAFSRYVVLDNGISMANLRQNIIVLLDLAPRAYKTATGAEEE